jgi:FkbM family methyltransferase
VQTSHYPGMVRLPHLAGALTYAAAWLVPWRSVYRVRPHDTDLAFLVHRRDVIGRHIAKYGTYEAAMTGWIARHLASSPEGIFIDVGANMGWHAVQAARHPNVETVVAFEPDAFNAWLLDRNLSINHVDNVVVCACALGARSGIAKLHRYKPSNLGRHSLIADYGRGTKLVPVRDLDGALDNLHLGDRRIVALKIDVEGYEPAVIDGASRALIRADVVVLEYTPTLSRDGGLSVDRMIDRLHRCGFKAFALDEAGSLTPLEPEWLRAFEGQMDVIWTR